MARTITGHAMLLSVCAKEADITKYYLNAPTEDGYQTTEITTKDQFDQLKDSLHRNDRNVITIIAKDIKDVFFGCRLLGWCSKYCSFSLLIKMPKIICGY